MAEATKDHATSDVDCWCEPTAIRLCPVCEPQPEQRDVDDVFEAADVLRDAADSGCWRCDGVGTLQHEADGWERGQAIMLIHNDHAPYCPEEPCVCPQGKEK